MQPISRHSLVIATTVLLAWHGLTGVSAAETVFLTTGATFATKAHRMEGDRLVLVLRSGGEITCASTLVARIAPDEMPDPDAVVAVTTVPYGEMIDKAAARQGVDPRLVRAVIQVESAFRAEAQSRKGAMGLMQLMPDTAKRYAVDNPYDPGANIEAGVKHLKSLLDRFELSLALAAYNAGEAAVTRFGGIPPYPETRNYVTQILRLVRGTAALPE